MRQKHSRARGLSGPRLPAGWLFAEVIESGHPSCARPLRVVHLQREVSPRSRPLVRSARARGPRECPGAVDGFDRLQQPERRPTAAAAGWSPRNPGRRVSPGGDSPPASAASPRGCATLKPGKITIGFRLADLLRHPHSRCPSRCRSGWIVCARRRLVAPARCPGEKSPCAAFSVGNVGIVFGGIWQLRCLTVPGFHGLQSASSPWLTISALFFFQHHFVSVADSNDFLQLPYSGLPPAWFSHPGRA